MSIIARFIRISEATPKDEDGNAVSKFYNLGFATMEPIGKVFKDVGTPQAEIDALVAAGLDLSKPATFSLAENDPIIPRRVLCHLFDIDNVVLMAARDRVTKEIVLHQSSGEPCLNGLRASIDVYPKYTYRARGGSEVVGLPPETQSEVRDLPEEA